MLKRNDRKAGKLLRLARQYYGKDDYENAKCTCMLALASELGQRHKVELLSLLGDTEFMRKDLLKAKDAYNDALVNLTGISETQNVRAQILVSLSNVKRGLGEFDHAESDALRALEIVSQQDLVTFRRIIEALCNLVAIYAAMGLRVQASSILSMTSRSAEKRNDPQSLSIVKVALQLMIADNDKQ